MDAFSEAVEPSFVLIHFLSSFILQAINIPVKRIRVFKKFQGIVEDLGAELLEDFRKEMQGSNTIKDQSILGLLRTLFLILIFALHGSNVTY